MRVCICVCVWIRRFEGRGERVRRRRRRRRRRLGVAGWSKEWTERKESGLETLVRESKEEQEKENVTKAK